MICLCPVSLPDVELAAWLALLVTTATDAGPIGNDDDPASHYSWDSTVPNRDSVRIGMHSCSGSPTPCSEVCDKPRSQLSIRPLNSARFVEALRSTRPDLPLTTAIDLNQAQRNFLGRRWSQHRRPSSTT
jgi:hypothetical protein